MFSSFRCFSYTCNNLNKTYLVYHINQSNNYTLSALTTNSLDSLSSIAKSLGIAPALMIQYFPGVIIEILKRKLINFKNDFIQLTYIERASAVLLLSASLFESSKVTNRSTVPISTARSLPLSETLKLIKKKISIQLKQKKKKINIQTLNEILLMLQVFLFYPMDVQVMMLMLT